MKGGGGYQITGKSDFLADKAIQKCGGLAASINSALLDLNVVRKMASCTLNLEGINAHRS
jgi:hypothetical protein